MHRWAQETGILKQSEPRLSGDVVDCLLRVLIPSESEPLSTGSRPVACRRLADSFEVYRLSCEERLPFDTRAAGRSLVLGLCRVGWYEQASDLLDDAADRGEFLAPTEAKEALFLNELKASNAMEQPGWLARMEHVRALVQRFQLQRASSAWQSFHAQQHSLAASAAEAHSTGAATNSVSSARTRAVRRGRAALPRRRPVSRPSARTPTTPTPTVPSRHVVPASAPTKPGMTTPLARAASPMAPRQSVRRSAAAADFVPSHRAKYAPPSFECAMWQATQTASTPLGG